jgi:hypothetical protein
MLTWAALLVGLPGFPALPQGPASHPPAKMNRPCNAIAEVEAAGGRG